MSMPLPPHWLRVTDNTGAAYFWNTQTQEVSWSLPTNLLPTNSHAVPPPPLPPPAPSSTVLRASAVQPIFAETAIPVLSGPESDIVPQPDTAAGPASCHALSDQPPVWPPQHPPSDPAGSQSSQPPCLTPPPPSGGASSAPPPGASTCHALSPSATPVPLLSASRRGGSGVRTPESPWPHCLRAIPFLARNMALISSALQVLLGGIILIREDYRSGVSVEPDTVGEEPVVYDSPYGGAMCAFCILGGAGMFALEAGTFTREPPLVMRWLWPVRTGLYAALALPGLFTSGSLMPPIIGSVFYLVVALSCFVACFAKQPSGKEWSWKWIADKREQRKVEESGGKALTLSEFAMSFPRKLAIEKFEQNRAPRIVFLTLYLIVNLALFIEAYIRHHNSEKGKAVRGEAFVACGDPPIPCSDAGDPSGEQVQQNQLLSEQRTGTWYPIAKAFGQLLNFNCAFMILPVVHSLNRWLHDVTSSNPAWYVAWIAYVLPLDKNIVFHKACAKYFILISVFGHGGAHYLNYSSAPLYERALGSDVYAQSPTVMAWGPKAPGADPQNAGFTGELLLITMLIIYAGAHEKVKRSHYETFWYSHHFFVAWFILLLFHAPVWKFWCIPSLVPYVLDRLLRTFYRGNQRMALARIYFWGKADNPDVVTLQFDNSFSGKGVKSMKYMEGHYLYLRCPSVESSKWAILKEWHPFTISSAPDEPILEVNMRVMPAPSSWTNKVARYLQMLDPTKTGEVELVTRNPTSGATTLGKVAGPNGRPFFMIDGPHGAPSQHVFNYRTSILVGAGIGVTPCASIMKGVVNYRWKKGFSPQNLHFFWVARLSDLATFKWLLVTLPELKASQLVHNEFYSESEGGRQQLCTRFSQLRGEASRENESHGNGAEAVPCAHPEDRHAGNPDRGEVAGQHPPNSEAARSSRSVAIAQQARARELGHHHRSLSITIFLTGCTAEQIAPVQNPRPGSTEELITALISTKDPATGQPYVDIRAGRPDWSKEFQSVAATYGKQEIGVVFCGAPMIARALKEACETHSCSNGTLFKLHKENF